jgi:hypothetical protein
VSAGKAALDAWSSRVLEQVAAMRRQGGTVAAVVLPLARNFAAQMRAQFPGRDKDNARVLTAAASMLAGLEDALAERGARPELIGPALLNVLGFAAEDLNQDKEAG